MQGWIYRTLITIFTLAVACAIVPRPRSHQEHANSYTIHSDLNVVHDYPTCFILDDAVKRFVSRLNIQPLPAYSEVNVVGMIYQLNITVQEGCDEINGHLWPGVDMNESCEVNVLLDFIVLHARQIWGVLRGLESIIQMLRSNPSNRAAVISEQVVIDEPNYGYRGFLLDTANHYMPVSTIFQFLDAMAYVKMNVFHWHIMDAVSFPYVSSSLPELSEKGARIPFVQVYTHSEVKAILEHARQRGIRVMPEFDTPAHTRSWGKGYPNLLTPCYKNGTPDGEVGPINPANTETFTIIQKLFKEADAIFPDSYIHLGGDEVDYECWRSNPEVQELMQKLHLGDDFSKLFIYYFNRTTDLVRVSSSWRKRRVMVWEEVFLSGYRTDKQTIIQVWNGDDWRKKLKLVTQAGFEAVLSACWYLNLISGWADWTKYYLCDPADFDGTAEEKQRVIGGAAAMWSGFVDDTNVIPTSWPRGAAVAERLWASTFDGTDEFSHRLLDIECQMKRWGLDVGPVVGCEFCPA